MLRGRRFNCWHHLFLTLAKCYETRKYVVKVLLPRARNHGIVIDVELDRDHNKVINLIRSQGRVLFDNVLLDAFGVQRCFPVPSFFFDHWGGFSQMASSWLLWAFAASGEARLADCTV